MISTQQLEAFWERYQREGVPNDLSMQTFCSMHNVPYNSFECHTFPMTSEEYIIRLLQTIESLDSTMHSMKEEIAFLRERLAKMDATLEEKELARKRLWALIEAKDQDNKRMAQQIADLLSKVTALIKVLEDKSH